MHDDSFLKTSAMADVGLSLFPAKLSPSANHRVDDDAGIELL